jgi:hypothetical protein
MDKATRWDFWLKTLALLGGIIAAVSGYITYTDTKEKEFYTTYWNKKLEFFIETSKAASTMATTTDIDQFYSARADYWELFYGRLSLVEGDAVKKAMMEFAPLIPTSDPPHAPCHIASTTCVSLDD